MLKALQKCTQFHSVAIVVEHAILAYFVGKLVNQSFCVDHKQKNTKYFLFQTHTIIKSMTHTHTHTHWQWVLQVMA